jgi:hypothetical protein
MRARAERITMGERRKHVACSTQEQIQASMFGSKGNTLRHRVRMEVEQEANAVLM